MTEYGRKFKDRHFPYNPAKVRAGLMDAARGWFGFWLTQGDKHTMYQACRLRRAIFGWSKILDSLEANNHD